MKSVLITSSILILLLAALRPLLRGRIDPRLQYALWLLIALRLLVPVELATSAYSALALLDRAERPAQVAQAIGQAHVPIPAQSYDSAYVQVIREYEENGVDTTQLSDRELERVDAQARERSQGATLAQLFEKYARPVWLGGAALAGLWFLLVNLRFRRRLRAAELAVIDPSTKLPVYVSDALLSPCLCGTFRPAIYITPHAVRDPDRLRHVLAHESTHYRHKDHWWALVRCLCLCLYWFDPLVWWAAALSRQDCELACDAGAIRRLGEKERIPYGRTLVGMIAAGRCSLMQTATTMTGGKRRVRQRVRLIARRPKTVLAVVLALALVLGAAVGCTFTGAPENSDPTPGSLRERLMDLPEELQGTVTAVMGNGSLVEYRLDVPADWVDEHYAYVLSVHTFQKEGFRGWPDSGEDIIWEMAAQDDTRYYAIHRLREQIYPSEYEYWDPHRAVRAFVEETLLATEGVEPYSGQSMDTLQERLLDVPATLQADIVSSVADAAVDGGVAVSYTMNRPEWTQLDAGLGWLLNVTQISQAELDEHRDTGGWECFARNGGTYFVITYATDVRFYSPDDAEPFRNAFDAIRAYAMEQVLATDGVEPYAPGQTPDSQQQRLADLPEEWRDKVSVSHALGGEVGCLASYTLSDPKWTDLQGGWLLDLYRMDEAGIQGKLNQGLWPAVGIFARSGDQYYALTWPSDGRYQDGSDLSGEFWDAVNAIMDYVKDTVLATEGVEPFDPFNTPPYFFSNVPEPPLEPGSYAIDGMDYTLVTSYEQLPEDPEQWYLVGQLPGNPVWMFTRDRGQETMFQVEDQLTQVFPYTARRFGGGQTHDGYAPQLMQLPGFGWGPKGTFGPFAVITHVFQGGTDQQYQLTVYDLGTDTVTPYVHDWEPLMNDFNQNCAVTLDEASHTATISYEGQSAEIQFDDILWDNVQQYGFAPETYEYSMNYFFNVHDRTFDLAMPVNPFTTDQIAVWTLRFTGDGFAADSFRFVQSDDTYTYISTVH